MLSFRIVYSHSSSYWSRSSKALTSRRAHSLMSPSTMRNWQYRFWFCVQMTISSSWMKNGSGNTTPSAYSKRKVRSTKLIFTFFISRIWFFLYLYSTPNFRINQILDVVKGFQKWKFAHLKNLSYNIGNKWERKSSLNKTHSGILIMHRHDWRFSAVHFWWAASFSWQKHF